MTYGILCPSVGAKDLLAMVITFIVSSMEGTPMDTTSSSRRRPARQNGAAIRALREKDGWSQDALAKAAGLSQRALSNIEREEANARIANLNRIARKLHVPLDAIMRDPGETQDAADDEPEPAAKAA